MTTRADHPSDLMWYVAGNLAPGPAAEIAEHLELCADCKREAEALGSMRKSLLLRQRTDHVPSEDLIAYEERDLSRDPVRHRRIDRHLDDCEECRADLGSLERARRVRESPQPAPERAALAAAATAAWRGSWKGWLLVAAAGSAVLMIFVVPRLRTHPGPGPDLQPARAITFAPPRRGGAEGRFLPAGGSRSIIVLLPFGAPEGTYRIHIEREDGSRVAGFEASARTDGNGRLTVRVGSPAAAGAYRLILVTQGRPEAPPYAYPFKVVAPTPDEPGEHRP